MSGQGFVSFLVFYSLVITCKGSSKEIDILWKKYGELKADVEVLEAKFQKYIDREQQIDLKGPKEVPIEGKGEQKENPPANVEDKTTEAVTDKPFKSFEVNIIRTSIEKESDGYITFMARLKAPEYAVFQCVSPRMSFTVLPEDIRNGFQKPYPVVSRQKGGEYEVKCFLKPDKIPDYYNGYFLIRSLASNASVNIMFNTRNVGTNNDFKNLHFQYRSLNSLTSGGKCLEKFQFRSLESEINENNTEIVSELGFINGTDTTIKYSILADIDYLRNIDDFNRSISFNSKNRELQYEFSMSSEELKPLHGFSGKGIEYRLNSTTVDKVAFWTVLTETESCLSPLLEGNVAFFADANGTTREGQVGSFACSVIGDPLPSVSIYRSVEGTRNYINAKLSFDSGIKLTQAFVVFNNTKLSDSGKYICEARSGSRTIRREIVFTVLAAYWNVINTRVISKQNNTAVIQLYAVAPEKISITCNKQGRQWDYFLVDKLSNVTDFTPNYVNKTASSTITDDAPANLLKYFDPILISYKRKDRVVKGNKVKVVVRMKLNLKNEDTLYLSYLICIASDGNGSDEIIIPLRD